MHAKPVHEDEHLLVLQKPPGLPASSLAPTWQLAYAPPPDASGLAVFVRTSAHRTALESELASTVLESVTPRVKPSPPLTVPSTFRHAPSLTLTHPTTRTRLDFTSPPPPSHTAASQNLPAAHLAILRAHDRRSPLHTSTTTDSYRLANAASDGLPGHLIDRLADTYLISHRGALHASLLQALTDTLSPARIYAKELRRDVRTTSTSPRLLSGPAAPSRFPIRENNLTYLASLEEGYSFGLFLDQRDTRQHLLTTTPKACEVLNVFAYTCAFSLACAAAGARTTSLDLSKRYLDWGRDNFSANDLDPTQHDWIFGDAFDWLRRLAKKKRTFDLVILDPPTFSTTKTTGPWSAERDYGRLARLAIPLVKPGGTLLASTNASTLTPSNFHQTLTDALRELRRTASAVTQTTQPFDFPSSPAEPAYLKIWRAVLS
jgi:23S rRNA (cytosine1962-C5)-methyltransferase